MRTLFLLTCAFLSGLSLFAQTDDDVAVLLGRPVTNLRGDGPGGLYHGSEHTEVDAWYLFFEGLSNPVASSTLPDQGSYSYKAENVSDLNVETAWVEGKPGYGIGEKITFTFNPVAYSSLDASYQDVEAGYSQVSLAFLNGLTTSESLWKANSRVKTLRFSVNNKPVADILLADSRDVQIVEISDVFLPYLGTLEDKEGGMSFTFEIVSVYPGTKYKDTVITEIMVSKMDSPGFWEFEK